MLTSNIGCFYYYRYTSGTDMVPYDNGAGAVNQNYRVDAGSASGPTPFNSGSLLGGRSYAINFVTAVSEYIYIIVCNIDNTFKIV